MNEPAWRPSLNASAFSEIEKTAPDLALGTFPLPMTDDPVRTRITTPEGVLTFQEYLVRDRSRTRRRHLGFDGFDRRMCGGCRDAKSAQGRGRKRKR